MSDFIDERTEKVCLSLVVRPVVYDSLPSVHMEMNRLDGQNVVVNGANEEPVNSSEDPHSPNNSSTEIVTALVKNQADDVQRLIDNGLDLKTFLTIRQLWNLYSKVITDEVNPQTELIRYLLANHRHPLSCPRLIWAHQEDPNRQHSPNFLRYIGEVIEYLLRDEAMSFYKGVEGQRQETFVFENPEKELFLWAILLNRREMAYLFWKKGKDQLMSGLVACSLLKRMSKEANNKVELELSKDLKDHAVLFEQQSLDVLSRCYRQDKHATHKLLVCEQRQWGGSTIFRLADTPMHMNFVEHTAFQTTLNDLWMGGMVRHTSVKKIVVTILFSILCPILPSTIRFVGSEPRSPAHSTGSFQGENLPFFRAIFYFYTAPVTKFYSNVFSHLALLCIFSSFVLVDLYPTSEPNSPSIYEKITWCWVGTLLVEEGRQIFAHPYRSLKYKIHSWFGSFWNKFDLVIFSLFLISIILRCKLFDDDFMWARMLYSITLACFYLRFMQFFVASKNIGPKVIMIRKMLKDLAFFFFILLVFIISFGVAYHVNLYPNHLPSYKTFLNIFYLPYWQMYGELFLERVQGDDDPEGCTRNETLWRNQNGIFQRCPEKNALVPVLMALYMILTNILLVNLLIAMFSYTFQNVQKDSQKIWRFYRLSLLNEYLDRPTLVPPTIILNHIYRLVLWIKQCCQNGSSSNSYRDEEELITSLRKLEKDAMEKRKEQLDNRVASAAERPCTDETDTLEQRVDNLTKQMGQHTLKQDKIMHMVEELTKQCLGQPH